MKVGLVTLEGGGIATVCYGIARNLARKQISATVFTDTNGDREFETVNDYMKIIRLKRLNFPPRIFWFQLQNLEYLLNSFRKFDIIHGVSADASILATFYKQRLKKPYVVSFHAEPLSCVRDFFDSPSSSKTPQEFGHQIMEFPLLKHNIQRCINYSDHILVCSYAALRDFEATYKNLDLNRVSVIYNAVNLDEINNVRVVNNSSKPKKLSIIYASRLFWVKGLHHLLEAFVFLKKDFKNVHLEVYGSGPEENRYKKFVSKAGLGDQVHFHGRIPRNKLIAAIKKADLAVAPSHHEAQSMYVLEAMACGKPVVAFDIPSMKEIITDGVNGVLAKSFMSNDLAEKIRLVLSDSELRVKLGRNALEYVREKHNWDKQIEKYLQVYSNLLH